MTDRHRDDLKRELRKSGLTASAVGAITHLLVQPMDRPEDELSIFLLRFRDPDLSSGAVCKAALQELTREGLLRVDEKPGGLIYLRTPHDVVKNLATRCEVSPERIEGLVSAAKRNLGWQIELIPHGGTSIGFTSWISALEHAKDKIDIWVTASSYDSLIPIIQRKTDQGVIVRIMTGDPAVVARLRGRSEREHALNAIEKWRSLAKITSGNIEVRAIRRMADLGLAGSSLIDEKVLRITVFSPSHERGSDGKLLAITAESAAQSPNLINLYSERFEIAWRRARRFGVHSLRRIISTTLLIIAVPTLLLMNSPRIWSQLPPRIEAVASDSQETIGNLIGAAVLGLGAVVYRRASDWLLARTRLRDPDWVQ